MLIVVKLKTLSPAGFRGGLKVVGSKTIVPGVVRFSAPSDPLEPLLKLCAPSGEGPTVSIRSPRVQIIRDVRLILHLLYSVKSFLPLRQPQGGDESFASSRSISPVRRWSRLAPTHPQQSPAGC